MNISTSRQGDVALVHLDGEIDLGCSSDLRKVLMETVMDRSGLVVDLSGVAYIDSSGIAALVEAYQGARVNATRFVLAAPSDPVLRVLRLAKLDRVFDLADSVERALVEPT